MNRLLKLCALVAVTTCIGESPMARAEFQPGWLVFSSSRTGNGDLYGVDPVTGNTTLIAGSEAGEGGARFDAHRDRLVHARYEEDAALLVAEGEVLFEEPSGDSPPVWSPDGTRIAYAARRDGQEDLFLADANGAGTRNLTNDLAADRYPAWSPDGRELVFARRLETGWDLHVATFAGADPELRRLTGDGTYVGHPAWSPDGTAIAYDTQFEDQTEIVILDLESGTRRRLTRRAGNDLAPAWSLDGKLIAFAADPGDGNWEVWTVDVNSLALTRVTDSPGFDGGPLFVPGSAIRR